MKQYRITSADFFTPGDQGEPDAYLSPEDLAAIKKAAGGEQLDLIPQNPPSDDNKNNS